MNVVHRLRLIALLTLLLFGQGASTPLSAEADSFDHNHPAWTTLLQKHVVWTASGTASQVDYLAFKQERVALRAYLKSLSAVSSQTFASWTRDQQLAFLINAYNAFTIELILTRYPDLDSIKDLGSLFRSPWKKEFFQLLGRTRHLDDIEHNLIRGSERYKEPLIHFVVNCASVGCPALRDEAFVADSLDEQLLDSTRRFLLDRSRNRFDAGLNRLEVSSLFDWYAEDFEQGWRGYDTLYDFFRIHAGEIADSEQEATQLLNGNPAMKFLDYDWELNDLKD